MLLAYVGMHLQQCRLKVRTATLRLPMCPLLLRSSHRVLRTLCYVYFMVKRQQIPHRSPPTADGREGRPSDNGAMQVDVYPIPRRRPAQAIWAGAIDQPDGEYLVRHEVICQRHRELHDDYAYEQECDHKSATTTRGRQALKLGDLLHINCVQGRLPEDRQLVDRSCVCFCEAECISFGSRKCESRDARRAAISARWTHARIV